MPANAQEYLTVRITRDRAKRIKKLIQTDPAFTGPLPWNLTAALSRIIDEWFSVRDGGRR